MKQFIALCGRGTRNNEFVTTARVGKDEVARILRENYNFRSYSFALPLKQATQILFGLSDAQVWNDKLKEVNIPEWNRTPRKLFQLLGTEGGRHVFREDLWGQLALNVWADVQNGKARPVIGVGAQTEFFEGPKTLDDIEKIIVQSAKLWFQVSDSEAEFSLAHDSKVGPWEFTFQEIVTKIKRQTIPAILGLQADEAWKQYVKIRPQMLTIGLVGNGPYGLPPENPNGLVIPDCRFDNEAEIVRDAKGIVAHVCREIPEDIKVVAGHASEMGVAPTHLDYILRNEGTLGELSQHVADFIRTLEYKSSPAYKTRSDYDM